jgi:hypothetical protein
MEADSKMPVFERGPPKQTNFYTYSDVQKPPCTIWKKKYFVSLCGAISVM